MKVLTIKQPFAQLIVEGYKEYEFRTWKTKYRGEFLIHAGKSIDKEAMERFKSLNLKCETGKIIGKCKITDCIPIDDSFKELLRKKDPIVYKGAINKETKEYAFKLENIEKIKPIPINGKLSFWEYNYKEK